MRRWRCPVPLLLLGLLGAASGRAEILERVVVKVSDQIITLSEFQARQLAAVQEAKVAPSEVEAYLRANNARILQQAIDEILLMKRAEEAGWRLPPEAVEEVITSIKRENNITSEAQMKDALAREGMTIEDLRRKIERSMTKRLVVDRDIRPKVSATDAECLAEYERLKATEFTKAPTVTLQEILVNEAAGGLALARRVVERARAGEDFSTLARTYSSAPSRANGGDVGAIARGGPDPELEEVAFALTVGSLSDPMRVSGGYRIVKVLAQTPRSVVPFETAKAQVRERILASRTEEAYEPYMKELRKDATVEMRVREVPVQLPEMPPVGPAQPR
jgi:peptidyl-prolyl cis-trans isomerase SurA